MKTNRWFAATICLCLAALGGCRKHPAGAGAQPTFTAIDWSNAGSIEGTVHYAGTPPKPVAIDMAQDPACALGPANYSEQYVVNNGGFANVFIYVKDGLGNRIYAAPSQPVDLDQKGCRYVPHVIGVMVGQPVRFSNSDKTMHNINVDPTVPGNPSVDISEPPNQGKDERSFGAPELMMGVRCNIHPWMQAFINVAPDPFFAVSDASGHYAIKGLPPGTYTVVADQEQMGQKVASVTVGAKQSATLDFTYGNESGTQK